jgi:diguanylate cyclase (GGDEF)-like protein
MDAITTAYLFTILGLVLNMTALGVSWHLARPMPGTHAWFLGAAISTVSVIPLLFSLLHPYPPLLSAHNAGVAIGGAVVVAGVYLFFGTRPPWRIMLFLIAGFMAAHSWYLYFDYDVIARTVAASLALAAIYSLGAWRLTAEPWSGSRLARIYASVGWWSMTLAMGLRAIFAATSIGVGSVQVPAMEANITYLLVFIVAPITTTAAVLGLIMMTVRRLADEREHALAEAREAAEHFRELATYDSLTGAYNRRLFMDRADEELSQCRRNGQPFSLLLIDLDHFKKINDSYGHASGDEALRYTAKCVRNALRDYDVFGRLGGEEFAVALTGVDQAQALRVSNRLCETMAAETICHDKHSFGITMSGGVATARAGDTIASLLGAADVALYRAKDAGRNRIEPAAGLSS